MKPKSFIFLLPVLSVSLRLTLLAETPPLDLRSGRCDENTFRMIDAMSGWARSTNAILKTTDGGHSWQKVLTTTPREPVGAFFYDAKTAWAVVGVIDDATNATIFHTTDGGSSWSGSDVCEQSPIMAAFLSFPNKSRGWLMLIPDHGMNSSPGELFRTDNAGKTWQHINTVQLFDNFEKITGSDLEEVRPFPLCGGPIAFRNATDGWLVGSFTTTTPAYLFMTHDAGAHWQGQTLPVPSWLQHGRVAPIGLPEFSPRNGRNGTIKAEFVPDNFDTDIGTNLMYRTRDGGLTWQLNAPPSINELAGERDLFPATGPTISPGDWSSH